MCFPADALPPEPPGGAEPVTGSRITLTAADGATFGAYEADAPASSGAGVVVMPDVRGLFGFYENLAERFAGVGIDAVAIDYFGRTAEEPPPARGDDFDFRSHVARTTPESVAADVGAAVDRLRSRGRVTSVFTVGFCFGGSYSFLAASRTDLAGVVGFYGGMRQRVEGGPTPISEAAQYKTPVLGLFGGADESIPPEKVEEFRAALESAGVEHTLHTYPGAPHSFFDRSFDDYSAECADAWTRVREFVATRSGPRPA